MNRLILIGNGFDLAHGLKTSFKDFIERYLVECINVFRDKKSYQDQLVKFSSKYYGLAIYTKYPIETENVLKIIEEFNRSDDYKFEISSPFFRRIFEKISSISWVDLEIEFFESLIETRNNPRQWGNSIIQTNSDLDFLRDKLIEYLKINYKETKINLSLDLANSFSDFIKKDEVRTIHLESDERPENLYFLNFNYTETLTKYFVPNAFNNIPYEFNYIHGDLNLIYADPIFGFGDELDKNYKEFEDHKNKELFKHIKSFHYLMSNNYFSLIRFIDSEDFQVHIYGHSCGLSDRTMLNQIFEHENCKSIKIYYHEIDERRNDFIDKTYDIARHFTNKAVFRKKLVPFPMSVPMPQPSKIE